MTMRMSGSLRTRTSIPFGKAGNSLVRWRLQHLPMAASGVPNSEGFKRAVLGAGAVGARDRVARFGKAQGNFTDPDGAITGNGPEGFGQCHYAQVAVDGGHQLIVATG